MITMAIETIKELLIFITPYIITALTFIGVVIKVLHSFSKLKKDVVDMKELHEVKEKLNMVLKENYELKKTLNETMTKIDHVRRD